MPKPSVVANSRAVATKGTPHMCWATAPDWCKVPPDAKPAPFPNWVMLDKLGAGQSKQTTYAGDPIFIDGALVGPMSEPDHPGKLGGVKSSTFRQEATNTECSPDVFVEGKGVVCLMHQTTQNHGNTSGIVTNAALLASLLEEWNKKYKQTSKKADEEQDEGDDNDNEGRDTDGEEDEAEDEDAEEEEEQVDEQVECGIDGIQVRDANGRALGPSRILEVVPPAAGERIFCETTILATHGEDHPKWMAGGRDGSSAEGVAKFEFRVYEHSGWAGAAGRTYAQNVGNAAAGVAGNTTPGTIARNATAAAQMIQLFNAGPEDYGVNVTACQGEEKATVKAYPWAKPSITLGSNASGSAGRSLGSHMNVMLMFPTLAGVLDKTGLIIKLFEGSVSLNAAWSENAERWTVTCYLNLEAALNPLLGLEGRFEIPWGPLEWLNRLLGAVGVDAGVWVKPQGGVNVSGALRLGYTPSNGDWGVSGKATGELYIGVGIELGINPDSKTNRATAEGNARITGSASIVVSGGPTVTAILGGNLGKCTAIFKVIVWGFTVVDETVPLWEGYPIGPHRFPLIPDA